MTIRRLLVFGVCLVGVGCLYHGSSTAGSTDRIGSAPARTAPPGPPASASASVESVTLTAGYGPRTSTGHARLAATAAAPGRDETPPEAAGRVRLSASDAAQLTVTWSAARDDVGVVGYRVRLNGFLVLTTPQTRATLAWFNDTNTHVVQVAALDAAGNEGAASPTLMLVRPSEEDGSR